jgi:hypothetical protein
MKRTWLYFFLAVIPTLLIPQPPQTNWALFTLVLQSLYQGLLAVKALQSDPDKSTPQKP